MQGDVQPPSNGEDRLEGEGFQDEGNDGGAEAENLAEDEEFAEGQPPEGLPGHRLTRRQVLIGGAIAGGALIGGGAGTLYLLLRGDGDEDQVAGERPTPPATETPAPATVAPTEPPTQAPTPKPTVAPRPRLEYVQDAPGAIEERDWANGELIDWQPGMFTLNPENGAVHGWRPTKPLGPWQVVGPGVFIYPYYYFLGEGRFLAMREVGGDWLLHDRDKGNTARWPRDRLSLQAASSTQLIFAELNPATPPDAAVEFPQNGETGRFWVVNLEREVVSEFRLPGRRMSRIVIGGNDDSKAAVAVESSGANALVLIDLADGIASEVYRPAATVDNRHPGPLFIRDVREDGFRAACDYGVDQSNALSISQEVSWAGELGESYVWRAPAQTFQQRGPDGLLLRTQHLRDFMERWWPTTSLYDNDGKQLWRLLSVDIDYGFYGEETPRWLADGSAFIGAVRSDREDEAAWYALFDREGQMIEPMPRPPAPANVVAAPPRPSPRDAELIAVNAVQLFSRRTRTWYTPRLATSYPPSNSLDPWSGKPGEMVFRTPIDMWLLAPIGPHRPLLNAVLQLPPVANAPSWFRVSGTGSCLNLREAPRSAAPVLACLPDGTRLSYQSHAVAPGVTREGVIDWIWVATEDHRSGFVSSKYIAWD